MNILSKLSSILKESEESYFKWIWEHTDISKFDSILDFGCGKPPYASKFFRENKLDVYSYDIKGDHSSGWHNVSNVRLEDEVDVSLCAFVLPTLSEEEEKETIKYLKEVSRYRIYCLIPKAEKNLDNKPEETNNTKEKHKTNIEIDKTDHAIQTNKGIIRTPLLKKYSFKKLANFSHSTLWVFSF